MRLLLAFALAALLAVGLSHLYPDLPERLGADAPRLVYSAGLVVLLLPAFLVVLRRSPGAALKAVAAWGLIGLALVAAYAYRDEARAVGERVLGELVPGRAAVTGPGEVTLRVGSDGHFRVAATVNGTSVRMLVDTGASAVVLTPEAARRAGIDTGRLAYDTPVDTANGTSMVARARLRELSVGGIVERGVPAFVSPPGALTESLLGMSFLDRLDGFERRGDRLILHR